MSRITKPVALRSIRLEGHTHHELKRFPLGVYSKSDANNSPHENSNNQHQLLDTFYENTYKLKASFLKITSQNDDENALKNYFKAHKKEILIGANAFIEDINRLISESLKCDYSLGTHFNLLLETILSAFEQHLMAIGIFINDGCLFLSERLFYQTFLEDHEKFNFIFEPEEGLMDKCIWVHEKIAHVSESKHTEGQFIDIKG